MRCKLNGQQRRMLKKDGVFVVSQFTIRNGVDFILHTFRCRMGPAKYRRYLEEAAINDHISDYIYRFRHIDDSCALASQLMGEHIEVCGDEIAFFWQDKSFIININKILKVGWFDRDPDTDTFEYVLHIDDVDFSSKKKNKEIHCVWVSMTKDYMKDIMNIFIDRPVAQRFFVEIML